MAMRNPFGRRNKARDEPSDSVSAAPVFYMGSALAGGYVNERTALQASAVLACVRVIAETIASLPLHTYERTKTGTDRAYAHPMYALLHDEPNPEMTSYTFRETTMTHLLIWGNSYSQIIRNGRGQVVGLYPLLPSKMVVDRDDTGRLMYTYLDRKGVSIPLLPQDVLHVPGLGYDGIVGYSPIALAKNTIGLNLAAEEYGSRFFSNGATPAGALTHPATVKDPAKLRAAWNAAYAGVANAGKVAILEEGMKFQQIAVPNADSQFLETRKFQVEEICRLYRVPPHMIGMLDKATFSNIEHQGIEFATHTVRSWAVRTEQAYNRSLFTAEEKKKFFTGFNMDGLLRGDYKSRMEGYSIGIQNGFLCPNDVRGLENMNPIPPEQNGDKYMVNGNLLPLADVGAFVKESKGGGGKS
jgi:HK97 family phage portal protein